MTTPSTIHLQPGDAGALPPFGFPLDHPYVEHVWVAAVGPTSTLLLRRAAVLFKAFPDGLEVEARDFGHSLGLASRDPQQLTKTLDRLDRFRLSRWRAETGVLEVPSHVRPVPGGMLERLPASTLAVHRSLIGSIQSLPADAPPIAPSRPVQRSVALDIGA